MEMNFNFNSLVSLGNFNPAIVTPEFLKDVCKIDLGECVGQSNPNIPVHRELQFKNHKLIVDLERMQIIETGIQHIAKTSVLNAFRAYYSKLSYTPLKAVGLNINVDLIAKDEKERDNILIRVSNSQTYLEFFKLAEIDVTEKIVKTPTSSKWISSGYFLKDVGGLNRRINIDQKKDSFTLNYNFEAGNLNEDESKLGLLTTGYEGFYDEFSRFLKDLED